MQRNAYRTAAHLHFSLLREFQRVFDIEPEVPCSAFDPGMVALERVSFIVQSPVQHESSRHSMRPVDGAIPDRQRHKMQSWRPPRKPINAQVSIRFGLDLTIEFSVPFASDATAQVRAREWLDSTCEQFGCVPMRPTGKVLLLDKILAIADAAGAKHFQRDAEWGRSYAQAVSSALDRTSVQVDVAGRTVTG